MLANLKHKAQGAVTYARVSTKGQGKSGLGLAAQIKTAANKAEELGLEIKEVFKEVESGSRTNYRRPILREALDYCVANNCVLIIAKMDRLTRNFAFLQWIIEYSERHGVGVVACDVPELGSVEETKFLWRLLASVAELEIATTKKRTKAALKAAKEKGVKLGNPRVAEQSAKGGRAMQKHAKEFALRVLPVIEEIEEAGIMSLRGIAKALTSRGIKTYSAEKKDGSNGNGIWNPQSVSNVMAHRKDRPFKIKKGLNKKKIKKSLKSKTPKKKAEK